MSAAGEIGQATGELYVGGFRTVCGADAGWPVPGCQLACHGRPHPTYHLSYRRVRQGWLQDNPAALNCLLAACPQPQLGVYK